MAFNLRRFAYHSIRLCEVSTSRRLSLSVSRNTHLRVFGLNVTPERDEIVQTKNPIEEQLYDIPAQSSYTQSTDRPGVKPYLAMHAIKINDPSKRVPLFEDSAAPSNPWVTQQFLWKRKDILSALEKFIVSMGKGTYDKSKEVDGALRDSSDLLSPAFKARLRAEHQKIIVVPQIRGVEHMTARTLTLKINFYKRQGLTSREVCKMLSFWPKLLNHDVLEVQKKLDVLFEVGYTVKMIQLVLKKAPQALMFPMETQFEDKVSDIMELSVSRSISRSEAIDMIQRCPAILMNRSADKLHDKIKYLRKEIKFTKQQIRNILMRFPSILTVRNETLREKVDFCTEVLGASRSSVARCPRLFQCSLQRLEERYAFLYTKNLLDSEACIDDYGIGIMASAVDHVFAKEVGKVSLQEYEEFLEMYRKKHAKELRQRKEKQKREERKRRGKTEKKELKETSLGAAKEPIDTFMYEVREVEDEEDM